MENRRILALIIAVVVVAVAALAAWSYFGRKEAPGMEEESQFLPIVSLIPQNTQSARGGQSEFSYVGIIQKVDANNKFFEIKTLPGYPVIFEPRLFDDKYRIYFDNSLAVKRAFIETENGVVAKFVAAGKPVEASIADLYPGTPVRVWGEVRDSVLFAKTVIIHVFIPR